MNKKHLQRIIREEIANLTNEESMSPEAMEKKLISKLSDLLSKTDFLKQIGFLPTSQPGKPMMTAYSKSIEFIVKNTDPNATSNNVKIVLSVKATDAL